MNHILKLFYIILLCCSGCGLVNGYYTEKARNIALANHWQEKDIFSNGFQIKSFSRKSTRKNKIVSIYIEGDGFAWKNIQTPSIDPTPKDPISLRLAIEDPWPLTVYLGRPCQFLVDIDKYPICTPSQWTSNRYSEQIIQSLDDAIDQTKQNLNVDYIGLTGYSGGGTIAALIAERRNDVVWLITIAANLDHKSWTNFHHVTPLFGSLNPIDHLEKLVNIPQVHIVGDDDKIVPSKLVQSFVDQQGNNDQVEFITIDDVNHHCCWPEIWPEILKRNEFELIRRKRR